MSAVLQMLGLVINAMGEFLRQPDLLLISAVVLFLLYGQYLRIAKIEAHIFGAARINPWEQTLNSIVAGLWGGLLATALFVFIGVPLSGAGIWYLWILAIFLALIHPRFLCFSYAGGLLSTAHLIWGIPGVNVPSITAIVAALHLVEAMLIATTGAAGATPVYARYRTGEVVGGHLLQRFWPIPFAALVVGIVGPDALALAHDIPMPDWWPLIHQSMSVSPGYQLAYGVLPVVAALGYSDLALTRKPAQKALTTAGWLVLFSLVLLFLAVAAQYHVAWAWAAALFAPIGHEAVITIGKRRELRGQPVFTAKRGAIVLDVLPKTPAAAMGLRSGDIIKSVGGQPVRNKYELAIAMAPWMIGVQMDVENVFTGLRRTVSYPGKVPPLGAVLAPAPGEAYFIDPDNTDSLLQKLWRLIVHHAGGNRR